MVIDNGTGYSKMGYAGNMEPSYMMPSVVAFNVAKKGGVSQQKQFFNQDMDFYIGDEALARSQTHEIRYILRNG